MECNVFHFRSLVTSLPDEILPSHKFDTQGSQLFFYIFLDLGVGFARGGIVVCRVSALQEQDASSVETGSDSPQNRCTHAAIRLHTRHCNLSDALEAEVLSKLRITFEHVAYVVLMSVNR